CAAGHALDAEPELHLVPLVPDRERGGDHEPRPPVGAVIGEQPARNRRPSKDRKDLAAETLHHPTLAARGWLRALQPLDELRVRAREVLVLHRMRRNVAHGGLPLPRRHTSATTGLDERRSAWPMPPPQRYPLPTVRA